MAVTDLFMPSLLGHCATELLPERTLLKVSQCSVWPRHTEHSVRYVRYAREK